MNAFGVWSLEFGVVQCCGLMVVLRNDLKIQGNSEPQIMQAIIPQQIRVINT